MKKTHREMKIRTSKIDWKNCRCCPKQERVAIVDPLGYTGTDLNWQGRISRDQFGYRDSNKEMKKKHKGSGGEKK